MWVLITSDLFEDIVDVYGPFATEEEAEDYGARHNLGHYDRSVVLLKEANAA